MVPVGQILSALAMIRDERGPEAHQDRSEICPNRHRRGYHEAVKFLFALVCAVSAWAQTTATVFYALPLGAVKPAGWIRQQLRIQADGLTGHLDEFWPDVGPNSAWLGGNGEGWERGPYYLDGLVPLAYLLDDPVLIAKARKWVDWTLEHQRPNGAIGPEKNSDWWPNMVMLKALTQYQEVTGDPRVIPVLERYFNYQSTQLAANPLQKWAQFRWGDEVLSIVWLYNRTGDPKLLDLARQLSQQGFNWKGLFADYPFKQKVVKKDATLESHGVNNAMALKTEALWSLISGDPSDREASRRMIEELDRYHGLPGGIFAADEHLAGHDPSQGTELCTVVEEMFSLEVLVQIYGDADLANRLEQVAYNALPGAFSKDMWAHQYDQQPNQVVVSNAPRDWTTNGPQSNLFGLEPNFGCCTANMHQGWPKFVSSLWVGTADKGLAAISYAPADVRTSIKGTLVHLTVDSQYPFGDEVNIKVDPAAPLTFPLKLRIPRWTSAAVVRVNGVAQRNVTADTFLTLTREWHTGDTVFMRLPMPIIVSHAPHGAVYVDRGPLLYSLAIGEKWKKLADKGETADWEVDPSSRWNYALVVDAKDPQSSFEIEMRTMGNQPFSLEGTPVRLHAKGIPLQDWRLVNNSAGPLPESPVKAHGTGEAITLVPYAAAKLRITEFPEASK